MLKIEIDLFSGRPNPVWIVTDGAETERFLDAVAEARGAIAKQGVGFIGLGLREVRVALGRLTSRERRASDGENVWEAGAKRAASLAANAF